MTQWVCAPTVCVMFERVLVGVDGRPGGRDAIALARRLAGPGAALLLANVYDEPARRGAGSGSMEAKRLLVDERVAAGLHADTVVTQERRPGRGLDKLAADEGADLLVVGSCHRSAIGRVLLGDDAQTALNGAPCAVAIAPRGYDIAAHQMRAIGVGHDGSPESEAGLHAAREIALANGAEISVLAVVSLQSVPSTVTVPIDWTNETERAIRSERSRVAAIEAVSADAVYGDPGEELVKFAEDKDLLIVGSRAEGSVGRLLDGSTSNYLARRVACPLLVIRRAVPTAAC